MPSPMKSKRVPAIDKAFRIIRLLAGKDTPLGISEMARTLQYNKSTVFNIVQTLKDLSILEPGPGNRFRLGTGLYLLARTAGKGSELIRVVHPYLEEINERTKLSAFLGIRSGMRAVILDKVDSAFDIRISSEIGMRLPLLAGAGGKAILSQMTDAEIDAVLAAEKLPRFTPRSCVDKARYREMIKAVRKEGIATDREEYIEGIFAFAVPVRVPTEGLLAAIWAVGLKSLVPEKVVPEYASFLKRQAAEIESRFFLE